MTLPQFEAQVEVRPATEWGFGGTELLEATVVALRVRRPRLVVEPGRLSFTTNIPRQVGLSGSSAIIMAALRALGARSNVDWDPVELAKTTLEVETDVLGWAAGPQDRVVQAYEGLVDMDFAEAWQPDRYHRLDSTLLPPLFVAWNRTAGQPSDIAHSNVRERWRAGDTEVATVMTQFATLAAEGRRSLDAGTALEHWPPLMDEAFTLRSRIWNITSADRTLVETGQSIGAGVAFAGSGGAVVGATSDYNMLAAAATAYTSLGAGFMVVKA